MVKYRDIIRAHNQNVVSKLLSTTFESLNILPSLHGNDVSCSKLKYLQEEGAKESSEMKMLCAGS